MTHRQRINVLLHHYRDVLLGIYSDPRSSDDVLALMCRTWNHPSYQQLERLLARMRENEPRMWLHTRLRFLDYEERRRAWCRRCGDHPVTEVGKVHGGSCSVRGRSQTLRAVTRRVFPPGFDLAISEQAISWLAERWRGEVDIPALVLAIESERSLREGEHSLRQGEHSLRQGERSLGARLRPSVAFSLT